MDSEQFFLKWNNFESNLASGFADLLQREAMVDVTLAAEGKIVQAHKIILSVCSSYFRNMFQVNPCQHPIVILKDVRYQELADMLDFMYKGEANVRQEDLPSFLKLAETLKVKGLAGNQVELSGNSRKRNFETQISNLTKEPSPFVKEEPSSDFLVRDTMIRKKAKRCISPVTYAEAKDLPRSPETGDRCENFVGNIVDCCQNVIMKEERLNDSSLDSYGENPMPENLEVRKNAGPSTVDENSESVPQEFKFRFDPKRVPIWDFYVVNYDHNVAHCKVCHKVIKTRRRDGTRNVLSHMRNLHPSHYALSLQFKERWKFLKQRQTFHCYENLKPFKWGYVGCRRQTKDYCFMESCFGGHLLILKGYIYRRKSVISDRSYWNCCTPKCCAKGILLLDGEFQLTNSRHNHKPDFENLKRKEKLLELKKLALQVDVPGQELLEALQIKDDIKKHLALVRTWRRRAKKSNQHLLTTQAPFNVGVNYKLIPSRIPSKEILFHLGHYFRQDSVNPKNQKCKYWRCKVKRCKARAKTDHMGNLIILQSLHNHVSEECELTPLQAEHILKASGVVEPLGDVLQERCNTKGDTLKEFSLKTKGEIEEEAMKVEKQKLEGTYSAPLIEEANSGFCPSENFSLDKLMVETLDENYCVTHEFGESLNLLKSE